MSHKPFCVTCHSVGCAVDNKSRSAEKILIRTVASMRDNSEEVAARITELVRRRADLVEPGRQQHTTIERSRRREARAVGREARRLVGHMMRVPGGRKRASQAVLDGIRRTPTTQ